MSLVARRLGLLGLAAGALHAATLPNLQQPPAKLSDSGPKLSPLIAADSGKAAWPKRREELKHEWTKFLGEFPKTKAPLAAEFLVKEELPTFTRQLVTFQIEEGVRTDAMLLLPKNAKGKLPGIVLFHPTYSNHYARAVGLEGGEEPERQQAVQLVERGYVVLAPR
ncbi:MAG: hypothetical protein HY301_16870, partial [Verrucomicrobia bacterium]|nr:hypothetical protein [Verrucomicrobiota bacterium]